MNSDDLLERLYRTFNQRDINYDLVTTLQKENVFDTKNTIKIFLVQFLIVHEDKTAHIKNKDDLWFIRENVDNLDIIRHYIELLIDLTEREEHLNIDIIKEIEPFMNTEIGTKLIYLISLLNKCNLPSIIYLLYLGFIIGENQEFIKNNYLSNLLDLLKSVKSSISHIEPKMQIYSLSEKALEIMNLYFFAKVFLSEEKTFINSIEKKLIDSDYDENDLKLYYINLEKEKLLGHIFAGKENNISSEVYKKKVLLLTQDIKEKIYALKDINKNQLVIQSSKNDNYSKGFNKEEEGETINMAEDKKENKLLIESNISSSNNKLLINDIGQKKYDNKNGLQICIQDKVDENEKDNKIFREDNIQVINKNKRKDSIDEFSGQQIETINKSFRTNDGLLGGSDSKGKNDNSFINNSNASITKENCNEKKTSMNFSKNSHITSFEDKFYEQLNKYVNYPKIEELNIPIDNTDKKKEKYLPIRISNFTMRLEIIIEKFDNILKSSIFDMLTNLTNIKNNSKFKLFAISNLRLEILTNLLKNANIINIKRKLVEVMIFFHLFLENKEYFELNEDYTPSSQNIKDLENLIRAKDKKCKNNDEILNKLNNLINNSQINELYFHKNEENKIKLIDENKRYELKIAKKFLDFYKKELNPGVHIGKDKADFYLLPRSMFNSETLLGQYLYNLEAILSEEKEEDNIPGLNKKKMKVVNFDLYNSNKNLDINEAVKILFSFNSKCKFLQNKDFDKIKERQKEFEKDLENSFNYYKTMFLFNLPKDKKNITFNEKINNKIEEYVEIYQKEVLNKISNVLDSLFEGKINDNKKIIDKIKIFFENFLKNCYFDFDFEDSLKNDEQILYFLKIKILIIDRIISFFENLKCKIIELMKNKEKNYKEMLNTIMKKMKELKNYLEKNHEFETENEIYVKWIQEIKFKRDENYSLKKIKEYLKYYIKKDLNLEMNCTYDSQFCLWAIKNGFAEYFD